MAYQPIEPVGLGRNVADRNGERWPSLTARNQNDGARYHQDDCVATDC